MLFADRIDAGFQLAEKLREQADIRQASSEELLVLSLPRGGVIPGDIIARVLHCPHDILIVKKIGFPKHEELAMGAIAENGVMLLNSQMIIEYGLSVDEIEAATNKAREKLEHYARTLRQHEKLKVAGKTVILVDDGIATGESMKAAIRSLRKEPQTVHKIIVAVPVASPYALDELIHLADKVLCLHAPEGFTAVGQFYKRFSPVEDKEVIAILEKQPA